jgi:hypothetical protein
MPKIFQVPALVVRANPMKDGGMSLGFHTNEISNEEKITLMNFMNSFGYLLFKENKFSETEIPAGQAPSDLKSPAQRLRAVIFCYSQKLKIPKEEFDQFYNRQMEAIIEQYKDKLE